MGLALFIICLILYYVCKGTEEIDQQGVTQTYKRIRENHKEFVELSHEEYEWIRKNLGVTPDNEILKYVEPEMIEIFGEDWFEKIERYGCGKYVCLAQFIKEFGTVRVINVWTIIVGLVAAKKFGKAIRDVEYHMGRRLDVSKEEALHAMSIIQKYVRVRHPDSRMIYFPIPTPKPVGSGDCGTILWEGGFNVRERIRFEEWMYFN